MVPRCIYMTTHTAIMTDKDRADLAEADRLKADGRALRLRVLRRLRQRAWRAGQ